MSIEFGPENTSGVLQGSVPARVLGTESYEDEFGINRLLMIGDTARGIDVIATLQYYQPREAEFRGRVLGLFDTFITNTVRESATLVIVCDTGGSGSEHTDSAQSLIRLCEMRGVDDVDAELMKIYGGDTDAVFRKKLGVLTSMIDAGYLAGMSLRFYDDNEMGVSDEQIEHEMDWLTRTVM